jgi:hypothetical protein
VIDGWNKLLPSLTKRREKMRLWRRLGDEFVDKNLLSYFILSAMVEKKSSIV